MGYLEAQMPHGHEVRCRDDRVKTHGAEVRDKRLESHRGIIESPAKKIRAKNLDRRLHGKTKVEDPTLLLRHQVPLVTMTFFAFLVWP